MATCLTPDDSTRQAVTSHLTYKGINEMNIPYALNANLTSMTCVENVECPKRGIGCRCGLNARRKGASSSKRVYKSSKRCRCMKVGVS